MRESRYAARIMEAAVVKEVGQEHFNLDDVLEILDPNSKIIADNAIERLVEKEVCQKLEYTDDDIYRVDMDRAEEVYGSLIDHVSYP